jgi:thiamine-phosphate pyrophosphorylase
MMTNIQFITHYNERYSYADSAMMALKGGCKWIQLRMKDATDEDIIKTAAEIEPMCRTCGATFIVDDHVALVEKIKADGVHLGQNDMKIDEARRLLGDRYIIGGTANTFEQAKEHFLRGVDYIGCGPFRFTTTKKNLAAILGLEGYRQIVRRMKEEAVNIPLVAIGGIEYDDIKPLLQTGVGGIALSGSVLNADDPIEEMKKIISIK